MYQNAPLFGFKSTFLHPYRTPLTRISMDSPIFANHSLQARMPLIPASWQRLLPLPVGQGSFRLLFAIRLLMTFRTYARGDGLGYLLSTKETLE
jgi:hypothetical protein